MPTSSNEPHSYPSRRSLREAREAHLTPDLPAVTKLGTDASPELAQTATAETESATDSIRLNFDSRSFVVSNIASDDPVVLAANSQPRAQRAQRKPRRILAATFAGACVATLSLTTALPLFATANGADDFAPMAAQSEQHLYNGTALNQADALDAIGAVSVRIDPTSGMPVIDEPGLVDPELLSETKLRMPFDVEWPLTDGFAYRTAPVEQFHDAQDIAAPAGTPVLAIGDAVVVEAGYATDGCGFSIKLQHKVDGDTLSSRYCHMQDGSHAYQVGDAISAGVQIGRVGNTGLSFGPHLHLALRLNGVQIDPLPFIASKTAE